jgi:hypothetical protein
MSRLSIQRWPVLVFILALLPLSFNSPLSASELSSYRSGFPVNIPNSSFYEQSTVAAEIVPSSPGLEIAAISQEGYLTVVSANGAILWQKQVPPSMCGTASERVSFSHPAVGALYGDGVPYVVVGYGDIYARSDARYCPGGVTAFHGPSGDVKWRLSIDALSPDERFTGVFGTVALADTDGNGTLEVAFGALDRHFYLLRNDGSLIWRFHTADTVFSSPTFADVNGDGRLEVIFGTDISKNDRFGFNNGGFIYAFKTTAPSAQEAPNGRIGFNANPSAIPNLVWRSENFEQAIQGSPAVGDVNGDGVAELVATSSCHFKDGNGVGLGRWVKLINLANGKVTATIPLPQCSTASPALADLNNDNVLDIVLPLSGLPNGECRVVALTGKGQQLWNVKPTVFGGFSDQGCDRFRGVTVADIDKNGSQEVLVNNALGIVVLAGSNGQQLSADNPPSFQLAAPGQNPSQSVPVVADLDGDGNYELIAGALNKVIVWNNLGSTIKSSPNSNSVPGYAAWPMFRGNAQRTGFANQAPLLVVVSDSVGVVVRPNSGRVTAVIGLQVQGVSQLSWQASESISWLSLSATSGSTNTPLRVTFDPGSVSNKVGVYNGDLTLRATNGSVAFLKDGKPASSVTIKVRMVISERVQQVYLPIVRR